MEFYILAVSVFWVGFLCGWIFKRAIFYRRPLSIWDGTEKRFIIITSCHDCGNYRIDGEDAFCLRNKGMIDKEEREEKIPEWCPIAINERIREV